MGNVEGHGDNVNSKAEQPMGDLDAKSLLEEIGQLKSTNDRLLAQSKEHADKWRALRDQSDKKEKLELEEQENWKALLDKEKNDRFELEENFKNLKKNALKKDLDFTVAKLIDRPLAKGATIEDVIDNVLKTGVVEVAEDESHFLNIEDAYNKVKESKSFLFDSNKPPMTNAMPNNDAPKDKPLSRDELFSNAIKQIIKK